MRSPAGVEGTHRSLGVVPPSEVAVWYNAAGLNLPAGRHLQAVAIDEARGVAVMFGGTNAVPGSDADGSGQETWEWSPTTGKWTLRPATGATPTARAGAAMVYDSARGKLVLFGGRALGANGPFEDSSETWE